MDTDQHNEGSGNTDSDSNGATDLSLKTERIGAELPDEQDESVEDEDDNMSMYIFKGDAQSTNNQIIDENTNNSSSSDDEMYKNMNFDQNQNISSGLTSNTTQNKDQKTNRGAMVAASMAASKVTISAMNLNDTGHNDNIGHGDV